MPRSEINIGEYYHIYNRGINKQKIFLNDSDYARMLFYCLFFQSGSSIPNVGRYIANFIKYVQHPRLNIWDENFSDLISNKKVELNALALMPNHFHLLVHEKTEGGIGKYLQRIENAYTKYFNTKYERSGYLFQGPFQSVHISNNGQLLYLSAYIHRNPIELYKWRKKEKRYPWSSYQDYIKESRWQTTLEQNIILAQFDNRGEYENFVDTSSAKEPEYFE